MCRPSGEGQGWWNSKEHPNHSRRLTSVMELVDMLNSKFSVRKDVRVQVPRGVRRG